MAFTDNLTERQKLIGGIAAAALVFGGGGLLLGQSTGDSAKVEATNTSAPADAKAEESAGPVGLVAMDATRAKATGVMTETVAAGGVGGEVLASAIVAASPEGEAVLTARADGAIVRLNKRLGDYVRAGESVASLESREASQIAADSGAARARAGLARSAYAREKRLFDARVTARQDLEGAQAALGEAEAELRRTQAAAGAAKVSGDGRTLAVVSLISGRVTKANATLGAYVTAGTELFRVADPSRIQINASVTPEDARRVSPGDAAVIELGNGETRRATVRSATPSLDPETRSATLVLTPEGIGGLTPGLGLRVRIMPRNAATGTRIALPEEAVQSVNGRDIVFVQTAKGFQATPVVTGARSGGRIEIVSGVKPGMTIVTTNAFLLKADLTKPAGEEE